jgi:hypothetical protein
MEKDRQFGIHFDAVTSQGSHRSRLTTLAHKVPNLLTFVHCKRQKKKQKRKDAELHSRKDYSGVKTSIHYSRK